MCISERELLRRARARASHRPPPQQRPAARAAAAEGTGVIEGAVEAASEASPALSLSPPLAPSSAEWGAGASRSGDGGGRSGAHPFRVVSVINRWMRRLRGRANDSQARASSRSVFDRGLVSTDTALDLVLTSKLDAQLRLLLLQERDWLAGSLSRDAAPHLPYLTTALDEYGQLLLQYQRRVQEWSGPAAPPPPPIEFSVLALGMFE